MVAAIAIGLATFVLHFARAGAYGYQRDELYFISCANHLAWGYVDQPPLIAVVAKIALLLGNSLYALRLLPALAATATAIVTGRLTRRLGGGPAAQVLAMLGIALAPFYLAVGNLLTMNAFEPLLWTGAAYLFVKAGERDEPATWAALGLTSGLGLINKYSMFFFLGACIVAIAFSPSRRSLVRPGFALAIGIALAIVAPTLVWQAQHGWPQLEVLRAAAAEKNVVAGPLTFYVQQILMMNPLAAPLWLAGLTSLLLRRSALRWYGIAYVLLSVVYVVLGAKVYYLAPIYPVLFAAGAAELDKRFASLRWGAAAYAVALGIAGLAIAPEAYPLLPLPAFLAYQHVLDVRSIKMEKHPEGEVPQHFADMLGWDSLVRTLARSYDALTPKEQRETVILTRDYGQASAVDFLGPRYGLPRAISGHNNYWWWGPGAARYGATTIAVDLPRAYLLTIFSQVTPAGTVATPGGVWSEERDDPIWICTGQKVSWAVAWAAARHYG